MRSTIDTRLQHRIWLAGELPLRAVCVCALLFDTAPRFRNEGAAGRRVTADQAVPLFFCMGVAVTEAEQVLQVLVCGKTTAL